MKYNLPIHLSRFVFLALTLNNLPNRLAVADEDFQYFASPDVDYWSKKESLPEKPKSTLSLNPTRTASTFPWKKYLDPKNDEFFKEGDYTPPAPFMEIARNPSDENVANWFHYLETKNEITRRLQEKLAAYTLQRSVAIAGEVAPMPVTHKQVSLDNDAKRFRLRLRLYFDSKCPHCQHMLGTLSELSRLGYWVELKQIDADVSVRSKIPFPVTSASASELKQYQIHEVPLLLVGDLKRKTFFKIQGYQTADSVLETFRSETSTNQGDHL